MSDLGEITELLRRVERHLAVIAAAVVQHPAPAEIERATPADPVADLRAWCRAQGHTVLPDGSVYEDAAAVILDRSPGTLKNWRGRGGDQLPFYRHGRTGRIRYKLRDLADALEGQRFGE